MNEFASLQEHLLRSPRRWLVTGGAGFIGSHLVEALLLLDQHVIALDNLATGHRANVTDAIARAPSTRGSCEFLHCDIRDANAFAQACEGIDYVLHQAALGSVPRSIEDPALYHDVNVTGFLNVLIGARDHGVRRVVYASSSAVYGDHEALPKREAKIGHALSPYALSKRAGEMYALLFQQLYGLESAGLRYFNVFGRRQDPRSMYAAVIPHWIRQLVEGRPCTIFGDGETTRDFCYVTNVVQANLLGALRPLPAGTEPIFNVGVGERTSLNRLYEILRDGLARTLPGLANAGPLYDDFRAGDVRHSEADITRIRDALGYRPSHTLARGLTETLEWYVNDLSSDPLPVAV